jgi:hypothetical protein
MPRIDLTQERPRKPGSIIITPKEAIGLFGGNEGKQTMDYIVGQGYGDREYYVDGEWLPEPKGQVRGSRYSTRPEVDDIAKTWRYIKEQSSQTPEKPDKILQQLAVARLKPEKLQLFTPWGPRYSKNRANILESDPETATLRELREIADQFEEGGFCLEYLLMPADVYGIEINGLPEQFVKDYFTYLEDVAQRELGKITVKPWSEIRAESPYENLRKDVEENFFNWVKQGEYENAVQVARIMNPDDSEQSAKRYCVERIVEANIINDLYDPIKISAVRKEKDALDGPLKRVYMVENKAPWMR